MKEYNLKIVEILKNVKVDLIVYDFDGVISNNLVYLSQTGEEMIVANRSDELGVKRIKKMNIPQIILSSGENSVSRKRAEKLGLEIILGAQDKRETLLLLCQERNYQISNVVYIGNDVNDLLTMKTVGYPFAPDDAYPEIHEVAKATTKAMGGQGVIREFFACLELARQGKV